MPDTGEETLRHLLLDQVLPRVLAQYGNLIVHTGAVMGEKGAVVFLGQTGSGKSTLAASFCQQGLPLLTDDCLLLQEKNGQWFGIPGYPGLRLWPDVVQALFGEEPETSGVAQYTPKRRVAADAHTITGPVPVWKMYVLDNFGGSEVVISALSRRDAFVTLLNNVFRLDVTDRKRHAQEFEDISRLNDAVMIFRLSYPRDMALLLAIQRAILEHDFASS